jgi:hypothetical protein
MSEDALFIMYKDAESRIGSHVAGGNVVESYIEKQRTLITAIQEELLRRKNCVN